MTVNGPAAADGDLVISFDNGATDLIVGISSEDDVDTITGNIQSIFEGDAYGTTIDNGDGTITFDFSGSDAGPYQGAIPSISPDTSVVLGGAPVVSYDSVNDGSTLSVDGPAAADGNLVLSFDSGATDITVALLARDDTAGIATKIAAAVNSDAGGVGGVATDNGDGTVTFDFSVAGGDYANAEVFIGDNTTVAQAVASVDSGDESGSDNATTTATVATAEANVPTAPVTSVANADDARVTIKAIDEAIKTVNIQRSKLGAVSNRLSHTVNNLTNISSNLSAAQGGIEDADFAHETTMLAKNQILQQASTAMLAQANASKQNVLSLLQG